MHSWEREKLGWINFTNKTTDGSETFTDYMTTGMVYKVAVSSSEYILIENRKKISDHDKAGDTGFYFYKVIGSSFPPSIDVLCADGNWDWNFNTSTLKITRLDATKTGGKDEMNVRYTHDSDGDGKYETYACYTPVYHENSAWGDAEDAFDMTFNNVLSPASNPRSHVFATNDFSLEVTGTNQITFYFDGDGNGDEYEGSPSKPQNLKVAWYNDHPKLTWDRNGEPDMQSYKISKMVEGETGWAVITVPHYSLLTTQTWTDVNVDKPGKFDPVYTIHYKIRAYDTQNKYSVYSEEKEIDATTNYLWKKHEVLADEELVITEYSLNQNYPNPFNPVTTISYQLPKKGQVALKIYNSLGKEVRELVNNYQAAGNYTVKFDGSDLTSGVYFYKIMVSNSSNGEHFSDTKKLILMK